MSECRTNLAAPASSTRLPLGGRERCPQPRGVPTAQPAHAGSSRATGGTQLPGTWTVTLRTQVYDGKEHSFHCKLYLTFHRTLLHFVFGFMKKSVFNFKPW